MVSTIARIGPAGTQGPALPAVIEQLSVSLPATRNMASQSGVPINWTFTAPQTGRLLIDTHLAFPLNTDETYVGWEVALGITGTFADGMTPIQHYIDEFGDVVPNAAGVVYPVPYQGVSQRTYAYLVDVIAGETYAITANAFQSTPSGLVAPYTNLLNVVLRISDYATERTGPTPNQEYRAMQTAVGTDSEENMASANHAEEMDWIWSFSPMAYRGLQVGHYHLYRGFGGVSPYDQTGGVLCAWNHARKKSVPGFTYWTPTGGAEGRFGPGTCQVVGTLTGGEGGAGGGNAGSAMTVRGWGLGFFSYRELEVWVYHGALGYSFEGCRDLFMDELHLAWAEEEFGDGTEAGSGLYGNGFTLSWADMEDPTEGIGEIIALEVAPDEFLDGGTNHDGMTTEWFMKTALVDGDYPWASGADEFNWPMDQYGQASESARSLGAYAGGAADWVEVTEEEIAAAKVIERSEANTYEDNPGLYFTLTTPDAHSASPPVWPNAPQEDADGNATVYKLRQYQALGFHMTGKYPDWIILDNPPYPAGNLGIAGRAIRDDRVFVGRQ